MPALETKHDVIIIGAGLAALQAARTLSSRSSTRRNIVMLEARDRIGGRALTHSNDVDLGCSMLHGYFEGNPGKELLAQLGIEVHIPTGAKGLVYGDDGPLSQADANALFATSTQMAFKPDPATSPTTSVADVLFPTLARHQDGERLIAIARTAEVGAGIELERTSAKWAGFEHGVSGTDAFPRGGYSQVVKRMAADFEAAGGEIRTGQEVVALEDLGQHGGVRVKTRSGTTLTAQFVLSTIPLAVLRENPPEFVPSLSRQFVDAVERTLVGNLEKVVLTYAEPWWPAAEQTGSYLLLPVSTASDPPSRSAAAPKPTSLEQLFERTTIPVVNFYRIAEPKHPTLLAYIGAAAARHLGDYTEQEISTALDAYLVRRLGPLPASSSVTPSKPTSAVVTRWASDPFSRGATSTPTTLTTTTTSQTRADGNGRDDDGDDAAVTTTASSSPLDFVALSRPQWDARLTFAGEHTDLDNHGSVAGALASGRREGERIAWLLEAQDRKKAVEAAPKDEL